MAALERLSRRQVLRAAARLGLALPGLVLGAGCGWQPPALPGRTAPSRVARIGYLSPGAAEEPREVELLAAFRDGLRQHGHVEGQTVHLELRWGERRSEQYPVLAAELVQLPVDVIVCAGGQVLGAARQATPTLPIVVGYSGDMVRTGIVASLARPGGNITGLSYMAPETTGKRLQLLHETVPAVVDVATIVNPAERVSQVELEEAQRAARTLGLRLHAVEADTAEALPAAFTTARSRAGALTLFAHAFSLLNRDQFIALAAEHQMPAIYGFRQFATDGGLLAYGADLGALYQRAAYLVDRILKGTQPADLPVEQPTRFEFIINLPTARQLGLTIPRSVLEQATEVIQ